MDETNLGWGRPATEAGAGWAVVDVETSGFDPGHARVISVAALALGDDGNVEHSFSSLLNPGVDPGPTHVHGLTSEMLAGQPTFGEVVGDLAAVLSGRTLVAHNAGFDYAFLAAECERVGAVLPVDSVMCTVELTRRLNLGTENLRLETLATHYGATQIVCTMPSTTPWCWPRSSNRHWPRRASTGAGCPSATWAASAGRAAPSRTTNSGR